MITEEQRREDEAEYAAAFGDDPGFASAQDDNAGLNLEEAAEGSQDGETANATSDGESAGEPAAVVLAVADGDEMREQEGQQVADSTTTSADEDQDQPTDPKEIQRQKSWEGRLRAREEELARREAELKARMEGKDNGREEGGERTEEAMEKAAEKLEADGDTQGAEAVENVAEKVQSGELTAQQAMEILAEDFGPEFVKMIQAIASTQAQNAAREAVQPLVEPINRSVQGLINSIVDDKTRNHFEAIADAHPDFTEIADSPEFAEFVKSQEGAEEVVNRGSAKQVIGLLNKFKKSQEQEPPQPSKNIDAAEGVRSTGMRLPEEPTRATGYEDAWSQF